MNSSYFSGEQNDRRVEILEHDFSSRHQLVFSRWGFDGSFNHPTHHRVFFIFILHQLGTPGNRIHAIKRSKKDFEANQLYVWFPPVRFYLPRSSMAACEFFLERRAFPYPPKKKVPPERWTKIMENLYCISALKCLMLVMVILISA